MSPQTHVCIQKCITNTRNHTNCRIVYASEKSQQIFPTLSTQIKRIHSIDRNGQIVYRRTSLTNGNISGLPIHIHLPSCTLQYGNIVLYWSAVCVVERLSAVRFNNDVRRRELVLYASLSDIRLNIPIYLWMRWKQTALSFTDTWKTDSGHVRKLRERKWGGACQYAIANGHKRVRSNRRIPYCSNAQKKLYHDGSNATAYCHLLYTASAYCQCW